MPSAALYVPAHTPAIVIILVELTAYFRKWLTHIFSNKWCIEQVGCKLPSIIHHFQQPIPFTPPLLLDLCFAETATATKATDNKQKLQQVRGSPTSNGPIGTAYSLTFHTGYLVHTNSMRIFTSALLVGCLPLATRLVPVLSDASSPPGAERAKPLPPEGLARPDASSDSDELNKTPPSSNLDVNTQRWGGPNEPASDRALAVVVPVHPGYSPYRLLSSIKPRAIRCPLGTVRNADLVLYYYDNYYYYYPDDDGRHDDEDDVDDRSLFDDVVYAVAGSIGRCFAEVRTVRTRLRQEEEEEGHKEQVRHKICWFNY